MLSSGQYVVLTRIADGRRMATGLCCATSTTLAKFGGGCYSRSTGNGRGDYCKQFRLDSVTEEESKRIANEIQELDRAERELRWEAEQRDAKAAYDALPEVVKLARALCWMCDCNSEKAISEAPVEHLRGIVAWAQENGLTTE